MQQHHDMDEIGLFHKSVEVLVQASEEGWGV
jgi:hypothetical protein